MAVAVQVGSALKVAATVQALPLDNRLGNEYEILVLKGAGKTSELPPQLSVIVKKPEVGGAKTLMLPVRSYVSSKGSHALAEAVMELMLQRIEQLVLPVPPVWLAVILVT